MMIHPHPVDNCLQMLTSTATNPSPGVPALKLNRPSMIPPPVLITLAKDGDILRPGMARKVREKGEVGREGKGGGRRRRDGEMNNNNFNSSDVMSKFST